MLTRRSFIKAGAALAFVAAVLTAPLGSTVQAAIDPSDTKYQICTMPGAVCGVFYDDALRVTGVWYEVWEGEFKIEFKKNRSWTATNTNGEIHVSIPTGWGFQMFDVLDSDPGDPPRIRFNGDVNVSWNRVIS